MKQITVTIVDERGYSTVAANLTGALNDVAAERWRQRAPKHQGGEGWTDAHDDAYKSSSMAAAAACYAYYGSLDDKYRAYEHNRHLHRGPGILSVLSHMWPRSWTAAWWKPKDRRRDLVRAAALLLAEIERLDRAEIKIADDTIEAVG